MTRKMKINNVNVNHDNHKEMIQTISGRIRKKLKVFDTDNLSWDDKKKMITEYLIDTYGEIPQGVSFSKRKTKDKHNPDGLRIFVICDWIKRNRFYDENGVFKIGTLINAINKQIEGKTNPKIMCE